MFGLPFTIPVRVKDSFCSVPGAGWTFGGVAGLGPGSPPALGVPVGDGPPARTAAPAFGVAAEASPPGATNGFRCSPAPAAVPAPAAAACCSPAVPVGEGAAASSPGAVPFGFSATDVGARGAGYDRNV